MGSKHIRLLAFCVSWLAGFVFLTGTAASAASRRVHVSSCRPEGDDEGTTVTTTKVLSVTQSTYIRCEVPSNSVLAHDGVTTLNVHGYEPTGVSTYSRACVHAFNSTSSACGTVGNWSSASNGALGVDTSAWNNDGSGFPYIFNDMGAYSQLNGFYMAN